MDGSESGGTLLEAVLRRGLELPRKVRGCVQEGLSEMQESVKARGLVAFRWLFR